MLADWRGVKDYEVFGLSYHRRTEVASAEDWNRTGLGGGVVGDQEAGGQLSLRCLLDAQMEMSSGQLDRGAQSSRKRLNLEV